MPQTSRDKNRARTEGRARARAAREKTAQANAPRAGSGGGGGGRGGARPGSGGGDGAQGGTQTRTAPVGGAVVPGGSGQRAPAGGSSGVQEGGEKGGILEALAGHGNTVASEKPPIPDPIAAGEIPGKHGRIGAAKGGRPKGSTKEAKEDRERARQERERADEERKAKETAKDIEGIFLFVFHIIAERQGAHWELTEDEASRLAYRFARVEQKWGGFLDKYAPEVALLGCGGMIVYPRLAIDAEKTRGKKVEVVQPAKGGENAA